MTAKQNPKKHYWMASVTISFVHEDNPMDTSINALTTNNDPHVTQRMIKNIQVQAQVQLAKSLGDQLPEVKHVMINSVSYLGYMSEEEFLDEQPEPSKH